jgi:hypothetical protein
MIESNGRSLKVFSPVSGTILKTNSGLARHPELLNDECLEKGWLFKVKPSDWRKETESYYLAEDAVNWQKKELDRFKEFMTGGPGRKYVSPEAMVIMQDGGEIRNNVLSELPGVLWDEFQKEFLGKK